MDVNRSGEMEVFVRVLEAGGFSAAARSLSMTPSAVAKLVARLEERLGARLVNRTTRRLTPTAEGDAFFERARTILADIEEAETEIASGAAVPKGRIRINASIPIGTHVIAPLLPEFLARHPGILVDLSLTDAVIDILGERADVAIRSGPLRDSRLMARKLGESRLMLVAAPAYLARCGEPATPDELADHNCLNFNFRRAQHPWLFVDGDKSRAVSVTGNAEVNNGETLRLLTLAGLGIGRLTHFHVAADIEAGRLVPVLDVCVAPDIEALHAVFLGRAHVAGRVRVFVDFLAEKVVLR